MMHLTVNGEPRTFPQPLSVAELVAHLGFDPRRIGVEINQELVPLVRQPGHPLADGDAVEIVRFVGGGAPAREAPADKALVIGKFTFQSRLITGTGKYASNELMREALDAS